MSALRRLWPSAPRAEIVAALPDRSWSSIGNRAHVIGVQRICRDHYGEVYRDPLMADLERRRRELKLSLKTVAEAIGVTATHLGHLEACRFITTLPRLRAWASYLGMEITARPRRIAATNLLTPAQHAAAAVPI